MRQLTRFCEGGLHSFYIFFIIVAAKLVLVTLASFLNFLETIE